MQAGGERAGRRVRLTVEDAAAVAAAAAGQRESPETVQDDERLVGTPAVELSDPRRRTEYGAMRTEARSGRGRFIDAEDVRLHRRVAFIGSEVHRKLFGDSDAVGQTIRIAGIRSK